MASPPALKRTNSIADNMPDALSHSRYHMKYFAKYLRKGEGDNENFIRNTPSTDRFRNGELYRCIADKNGAFVQPALYESFGSNPFNINVKICQNRAINFQTINPWSEKSPHIHSVDNCVLYSVTFSASSSWKDPHVEFHK
ncbi:hypothetical protein KIW84_035986 [Lathyrus oleraceus]|uniref:sucrose synthase n=1 Tax=Pisum sativum TaxID=3888 RepID=A0A9D4Y326_PEA|nr:hypothetical protein KIW84_035986 [Pisum sativum]